MPNYKSLTLQDINEYEKEQNFTLPKDYKDFMLKYGGETFGAKYIGLNNVSSSGIGIAFFTRLYKKSDDWYETNPVIDYKYWYSQTMDLENKEDYQNMIEMIGGNLNKKRIVIAHVDGPISYLTLTENGEVEWWGIDSNEDCQFEHVANSFTEFLDSLKPVEE